MDLSPPIPSTRTIALQAGAVALLAISICFLVVAWGKRQDLDAKLNAVRKDEILLAETEHLLGMEAGKIGRAFPRLASGSSSVWQEVDIVLKDPTFAELVSRLSAFRSPDRIFVPMSFSASGKDSSAGPANKTMAPAMDNMTPGISKKDSSKGSSAGPANKTMAPAMDNTTTGDTGKRHLEYRIQGHLLCLTP